MASHCGHCQVTRGVLNWKCAAGPHSLLSLIQADPPVVSQGQFAEWRADTRVLADVFDPAHPPWTGDQVAHSLYERRIVTFGSVWYTFICEGQRLLIYLTATCAGLDDNEHGRRIAREDALGGVQQYRAAGSLCDP